ncbi:uncharacterized protein [Branchiostoma lanceolatum]|uniref:uncharacterized protein n=1 Tax=Branchiostoma lanceolatum TaxID=7740 RepID=UPI00345303CF
MTCCLTTPCRHTTRLVHSMLQSADPPFSQHEQETYQQLWTIYAGNTAPSNQPVPDSVLTADMAKARFQGKCRRMEVDITTTQDDSTSMECSEGRTDSQYKPWEKCKAEISWSQFPLGCIPNQTGDISYLEVPLRDSQDSGKQEAPVRRRISTTYREDEVHSPARYEEQDNQQRHEWTPMELGMLKRRVVIF